MISVQTVVERLSSALDAEGSDRYTFNRDYKSAINFSVEWLQTVFNKAFADKKLTEENLKELVKVVVFQTNQFSRVNLNQLTDSVWSVLRVNPEPVIYPTTATVSEPVNVAESVYRSDLAYVSSKYSAKRLSLEQWEDNVDNIFEAGNIGITNSFKSYAFLNFGDYQTSDYISGGPEIEIRPYIPFSFVGVTYLKYPSQIVAEIDDIEFPEYLTNLVVEKALNFISYKQGDGTNLYSVTREDVNTLIRLMI